MKDKDTEEFKVRAYGRTELAQMYSPYIAPQSAYTKLVRWIRMSPELSKLFVKNGKLQNKRSFTPREVKQIVEILGEP